MRRRSCEALADNICQCVEDDRSFPAAQSPFLMAVITVWLFRWSCAGPACSRPAKMINAEVPTLFSVIFIACSSARPRALFAAANYTRNGKSFLSRTHNGSSYSVGAVYDRALFSNQRTTRGHRPRLQKIRRYDCTFHCVWNICLPEPLTATSWPLNVVLLRSVRRRG
jgi:hypothetical protein